MATPAFALAYTAPLQRIREAAPLTRRRPLSAIRCCARQEPPELPDRRPGPPEGGGGGLDGELRDMLDASVRDAMSGVSDDDLRAADRRVLDGIAEVGAGDLRDIGDAVSGDLGVAGKEMADRADELLAGELEETLKRFDGKRDELMKDMFAQRDVIREEAELIQNLAESLEKKKTEDGDSSARQSALFAVSGLFFLAALYYGWQGVVESSNAAMQSGVIDIVASAAAMFLYQRGQSKAGADDGK